MRRFALALALALAAIPPACAREEPLPVAQHIGGEVPVVGSCEARVASMREVLARMPRDIMEAAIRVPEDVQPLALTGTDAMLDGIPVVLHADGRATFDNQAYPNIAAVEPRLRDELDKANALADNTGRPFTANLLLVLDERAPVGELVAMLDRLPEQVHPALVITLPGDRVPPPPPTPDWVRVALAVPADERAHSVARAVEKTLGDCEPVRAVFKAVTDAAADERAGVLIDGMPGAVAACGCQGIDVEALTALLWGLNGRHDLRTRLLALELSRDPKALPVKLARDATGKRLAELVQLHRRDVYRLELVP